LEQQLVGEGLGGLGVVWVALGACWVAAVAAVLAAAALLGLPSRQNCQAVKKKGRTLSAFLGLAGAAGCSCSSRVCAGRQAGQHSSWGGQAPPIAAAAAGGWGQQASEQRVGVKQAGRTPAVSAAAALSDLPSLHNPQAVERTGHTQSAFLGLAAAADCSCISRSCSWRSFLRCGAYQASTAWVSDRAAPYQFLQDLIFTSYALRKELAFYSRRVTCCSWTIPAFLPAQ
jgi:hypothetical protein